VEDEDEDGEAVEAVEERGGARQGEEAGDGGREEEVDVGEAAGRRELRDTGDVIGAKCRSSGMPRTTTSSALLPIE
jgi:hypothetical protein